MRLQPLAVVMFPLLLVAQTQAPPPMALAGLTPIHTAPADPVGGAYGTWAAGDAYKVSFHDGLAFTPYLGRDYPVTRTVTWTTVAARLGEADLLGGRKPEHGHDDTRYRYAFGGFTEAYEVRRDGVEQTFTIAQPRAGELAITGRFGGNLRAQARADGGVEFADDHGVVVAGYGTAIAIDARGRTFPVRSTLVGDELTLQMSAENVAAAQFPLVVDPLLAPNTTATHATADPDSVDLARDDAANRIAICYLRHVSAVDQDAWVREFADDFSDAPGGDLVFTDLNTWGIQNVRICNVGPEHDWVAVVNRALPTVYLRYWVQPTNAGVLNTGLTFPANPGADNQWFADIGGIEATNQGNVPALGGSAMCVYMVDDSAAATPTDTTTIWAQRIDVTGGAVVLGPQFQVSMGAGDHDFPSITKVSEGAFAGPVRWLLVWQRYDSGDPLARPWNVVGTQVFDDDTSAGALALGTATDGLHRIGPKVEGQRGRYLVAYGALPRGGVAKNAALLGRLMVAQRFDWPAAAAAPTVQPQRVFRGLSLLQQMIIADVAHDADTDSHWAVLSLDVVEGYLRVHRMGYQGVMLTEAPVSVVPVGETHNGLGGICYDDDDNQFVLAWGTPMDGPSNAIHGQFFTFPAEAATSLAGPTCRPLLPRWEGRDQSGNVVPENDQQIGNQFGHVRVVGAPAAAVHFLMLSVGTAFVPLVHPAVGAGCNLLIDNGPGYLGMLPAQVGNDVAWNLPLPEGLAAFTLHAQDLFLDPATNLFYSSYRLSVPFVR